MIPLKSKEDLAMLKKAGGILAGIMKELSLSIKAGITTREINRLAKGLMDREKVESAFKNYNGFPEYICASINEEIVHGIPDDRKVKNGDIIGVDVGIKYKGYFSDLAVTFSVGEVDLKVKKLVSVTKEALNEGIKEAKAGNHLSDISHVIQKYVEKNGFSVVRQFVGHGIGLALHEEPEIPNFGLPRRGPVLKEGMVLAIEPMVNMGTWESEILDNGWTAVTKDRAFSAHFEHTVAITQDGPQILTS